MIRKKNYLDPISISCHAAVLLNYHGTDALQKLSPVFVQTLSDPPGYRILTEKRTLPRGTVSFVSMQYRFVSMTQCKLERPSTTQRSISVTQTSRSELSEGFFSDSTADRCQDPSSDPDFTRLYGVPYGKQWCELAKYHHYHDNCSMAVWYGMEPGEACLSTIKDGFVRA